MQKRRRNEKKRPRGAWQIGCFLAGTQGSNSRLGGRFFKAAPWPIFSAPVGLRGSRIPSPGNACEVDTAGHGGVVGAGVRAGFLVWAVPGFSGDLH